MKLEPGDYRTWDGEKVHVAAQHPEGWWLGWEYGSTTPFAKTWESDGTSRWDGSIDIIAKWTDIPPEEAGWEIIDDPEAVVEKGWQIFSWSTESWIDVCRTGLTVLRALPSSGYWIWFRRPTALPQH